jgi:activator of HSP90 ATPase
MNVLVNGGEITLTIFQPGALMLAGHTAAIPEEHDEGTNERDRTGNCADATTNDRRRDHRRWRSGNGPNEGPSASRGGDRSHRRIHSSGTRTQREPKRVYDALTDTKQFNEITKIVAAREPVISLEKSPTVISSEVGGAFSLFGGIVLGRHIELVPNSRIVQAWRLNYWNPGAYSIARFELVEQGGGTKIVFDHTGFPKGDAGTLASGWKAHYWLPLAKFLA